MKHPLSFILVAIFLSTGYDASVPSELEKTSRNFVENHFVGEIYGGGIVCYVFENGRHGLIAALENSALVSFYTKGQNCGNANAEGWSSSSNGYSNTLNIVKIFSKYSQSNLYAAKFCVDYRGGGYNDWYLPSLLESKSMFENLVAINTVLKNDQDPKTSPLLDENGYNYWCSTGRLCDVFIYAPSDGNSILNKYSISGSCYVRPMRRF